MSGEVKDKDQYIFYELKRINDVLVNLCNTRIADIDENIRKIYIELAALKVKSGIWGLIGGMIPVAIIIAYMLLKK